MIWPFDDLLPLSFDFISADPPWNYELYSEAGNEKAASAHYETMTLQQIKDLPVGHLARGDAMLGLYGCEWMPPRDRQEVMEAWGFTYKSAVIWRKTTRKGKVRMGPGYRVRTMHEPVYLGVMGNPQHKAFPSIFDGVAREHSRKPDEWYALVNKLFPQATKLDLFSRETRGGWSSWGREATKFDSLGQASTKRDHIPPQAEALAPMPMFPEAA